jgi:hypothetical protein
MPVDSPLIRKSNNTTTANSSTSALVDSSNASAPESPTSATDESASAKSPVVRDPEDDTKPPTGRRSRRGSVVHFGDFGDAADSAENTEEDEDEAWERAASEGALSFRRRPGLVIVPFTLEQRLQGVTGAEHDVGLVAFNGRLIGHLLCTFMSPPDVVPPSSSASVVADAATTAMDQSVRGGSDAKSKLKRGVKLASFASKTDASHAASQLAGVSAVRVEFVNTGEATISASQAILQALRYTHARPHHAKAGTRDCVIEVVIGETQNRVDADGNAIVSDNQNEPLIGTVQVCITAPLLRPMARGSVMELSYLENSGTKRLPLMDVYADDDLGSGNFDPNDASISFFVSKHPTTLDLATIRALDEKEFVVEGGKITVIEAPDEAQQLKERLDAVPAEMIAPLDTKALLPAQRHRLNPHAPHNGASESAAIIIRNDSTALGGHHRVGTMRLPPGGMSATDALVKSSTTGTFALKRRPRADSSSRRVTIAPTGDGDDANRSVVPLTIPFVFPYGAAHNPASKRALSMIDGRQMDDDHGAVDALAASHNGSLAGSFRGGDESGLFGGDTSVLGPSAGLADDEDAIPTPDELGERFKQLATALELRRRGIRSPFKSNAGGLMAYSFMRDRAVMAVAYIAPSAAVIVPRVPLKRKDMAFFLRSFSYANPDPNPRHLLKQARVSLGSGGCEAQCVFDLKIIPVDDPLEIFVYNSSVHHRLGAAETTAVPDEVARMLKEQREQHAAFATQDTARLGEARVGALRPFPLGGIKLYDPDTERWDRGSIQVDLTTAASRTDFVGFLTPEMQLRQYVLSNHEPGLLIALRTNDQPCFDLSALCGGVAVDADEAYLNLLEAGHAAVPGAPSAVATTVPLAPGGGTRSIDVYDCRTGSLAHPVHVGIATAKIESRAQSMVTTITFRKPRSKDEVQVVDCDVLTYMHNALQLHFGTAVPFPGQRQIKLTVADGQNPVPGRAQMSINVAPVAVVEKDRKLPQLTIAATRTKAPADLHACFGKAQFGLGDSEVYHDGCIEVILTKAAHESDSLVLRLNGSHMMVKDDVVIAGKDVVGRIIANTARYIRFQFAKNGKGPSGKRLVEIIKNVFASVQVEGTREVALVLTEGPISAPAGDGVLGGRAADSPKPLALTTTSSGKGTGGKAPKTASPQAASLALAAAAAPKPSVAAIGAAESAAPQTDMSCFTCILDIAPPM